MGSRGGGTGAIRTVDQSQGQGQTQDGTSLFGPGTGQPRQPAANNNNDDSGGFNLFGRGGLF